MLTLQDIESLKSEAVRRAIDENIERDSATIALDSRIPEARLVATEVKYLQRARHKLPRLYAARCIIPPRAFEQSSSQECALRKDIAGGRLLDLTCGLGIDTIAFAERFERVVSLERDEVLAEVVRHNIALLGIENVEVITTSAEEYVMSTTEQFDWVFADPDRRSDKGNKMVCLEDCSPNIATLLPHLRRIARRIGLKLSPLFDVEEAFRLFPDAEVEVVSLGGECKEVNIFTGAERERLTIAAIGLGTWHFDREDMHATATAEPFTPEEYRYLLIPDVALQKGRVAIAALKPYASVWSNNGYAFAREMPTEPIGARIYAIESIERYHPRELKRRYKGMGIEILKRDTPLGIEAVRKAIGARAGSERMAAITNIGGDSWFIELKATCNE